MRNGLRLVLLVTASLVAAGCGVIKRVQPEKPDFSPTSPQPVSETPSTGGSIYHIGYDVALFEDIKARHVGDILTVILVERTDASKNASASTTKDTEYDTGNPVVGGRPVTDDGIEILNNSVTAERDFAGDADASQSNSLDGSVTVTVAEVLPNGNLFVRGQKQIVLNQGEEYVQITGIVRRRDIGTDNTVLSTRVADAQIAYSGKGALADSNKPGWLYRFFNSPWFPY